MTNSLKHLPKHKQDELNIIRDTILEKIPDVRMIILFGSYARGNWVEDTHMEGYITHVYESDYDILVLTITKEQAESCNIQDSINNAVKATGKVSTPLSIIYHTFDYVKERILEGHYFFCDIKKEGVNLYISNKQNLGKIKIIPPEQRKILAQKYFDKWFESAKRFYGLFETSLEKSWNKEAAFNLHQATERFYGAVTLVFIHYRYRLHDIEILSHKAIAFDERFAEAFPMETPQQQENFKLLKRAYVDARYDEDYKITREQLEYLANRVKVLMELTKTICEEKIKSFV